MHFIAWLLAGLIAGWLTGKIMKGAGYGFFVDILLGIAGAFVGGMLLGLIDGVIPVIFGPAAAAVAPLIVVILILLIRPTGMFGHE